MWRAKRAMRERWNRTRRSVGDFGDSVEDWICDRYEDLTLSWTICRSKKKEAAQMAEFEKVRFLKDCINFNEEIYNY